MLDFGWMADHLDELAWRSGQQFVDQRRGVQNLLEIIEDQQQMAIPQMRLERVGQVFALPFLDTQRPRDRIRHRIGGIPRH